MSKPRCASCRRPVEVKETGRPRLYCSLACKQKGYRKRSKRSVLFSSASCEWPTDPKLFAELDAEFGGFTLDVCATAPRGGRGGSGATRLTAAPSASGCRKH